MNRFLIERKTYDQRKSNLAGRLKRLAEAASLHSANPAVRDRARQLHAVAGPVSHPDRIRSDGVGGWRVGNLKQSRQKAVGSKQRTTFTACCILPTAY